MGRDISLGWSMARQERARDPREAPRVESVTMADELLVEVRGASGQAVVTTEACSRPSALGDDW